MARSKLGTRAGRDLDAFFDALADPNRREILVVLAARPLHVAAIAEELGLRSPNVSQHLAILRTADLVVDDRDGLRVVYRLRSRQLRLRVASCLGCLRSSLRRVSVQLPEQAREPASPGIVGRAGGADREAAALDRIFRAVGEVTRREILLLLARKEHHVRGLAEKLDLLPECVSYHLRVLRQASLVRRERYGQRVYYRPELGALRLAAGRFLQRLGAA